MRWDVGIDLGTQYVRTADFRQGAVLEAAAKLAFREGQELPICCGDVAERLYGRACQGVEVVSPLRDGALANDYYAERLLRWAYRQTSGLGRQKRFGAMLTCAPFVRPVQQDALLSAAVNAGASEAVLVRSDAAAAIGAGLDLLSPEAKLLIDLGAGKVTVTLFTLGRVAAFDSLPYGFSRIDERIQCSLRTQMGYRIGLASAREIKHTLGIALPEEASEDLVMHMTGFSLERRLPESFDVATSLVAQLCEELVREIVSLCLTVLTEASGPLCEDLVDAGAVLTGGGAELVGIQKRIGDELGIPCRVADAPDKCAVRGLVEIMREPEKYDTCFLARTRRGSWR